jgi:hypothetical protein
VSYPILHSDPCLERRLVHFGRRSRGGRTMQCRGDHSDLVERNIGILYFTSIQEFLTCICHLLGPFASLKGHSLVSKSNFSYFVSSSKKPSKMTSPVPAPKVAFILQVKVYIDPKDRDTFVNSVSKKYSTNLCYL